MNAKALFALSLVAVAAAVSAAPSKAPQDLNLKFDEKYHAGELTVSAVSKQASAAGVKPGDVLVNACSMVANIRHYNEVVTMARAKGLPALTYGADKEGLVRGGPFAPLVDVAAPANSQDFGLIVANKAGLNALDLAGHPVKLKAGEKLFSVCAPVSTIAELTTLTAPFDARGTVPGWKVENSLTLRRENGTEYTVSLADAHN